MSNQELTSIIFNYIKKYPGTTDKRLLTYLHRKVGKDFHFHKDDKTAYWNPRVSEILSLLISFEYIKLSIVSGHFRYWIVGNISL